MNKKIFVFSILILIFLAGCKSSKIQEDNDLQNENVELYTLVKYPDAMLWEINGETEAGEKSKVYLLGTYHAGDERILNYPESVKKAIEEANHFCCELSEKDFADMNEEVSLRTVESIITDFSHTLIDDLTPDEINLVLKYVDEQTFAQLVCFEPWVLSNYLSGFVIINSGLSTELSYDTTIINKITEMGYSFDGLDLLSTQLDLTAYGNWDEQMLLLKDTLADIENIDEAAEEMKQIYEVFLTGDDKLMEEVYFKDVNLAIEENPVYKKYFEALLNERNEKWAVRIADYLSKPGTTFVFAGTAHFLGDNSVFSYMRENGTLK